MEGALERASQWCRQQRVTSLGNAGTSETRGEDAGHTFEMAWLVCAYIAEAVRPVGTATAARRRFDGTAGLLVVARERRQHCHHRLHRADPADCRPPCPWSRADVLLVC